MDVEHGWVFAIDPDYTDPGPIELLALKVEHHYKSFFRVRFRELVDAVFLVRKRTVKAGTGRGRWELCQPPVEISRDS